MITSHFFFGLLGKIDLLDLRNVNLNWNGLNFLFPSWEWLPHTGGQAVNIINLFKRQGSRLQEICTLTGSSVKIDFTETHPIVT